MSDEHTRPGDAGEDDRSESPRRPGVPPHQHPVDANDQEQRIDEEAEESFPSSDPPASGGPGI